MQNCLYIKTSQLICRAIQFTGFYMIGTLLFNELIILYYISRAESDVHSP